jgi:hypothetical protein
LSVIQVCEKQLLAMYPIMAPEPPANAAPLEWLYPNSLQMFEPTADWLPRNIEPGLAAMYPTDILLNREAHEQAYLKRVAPDLSQIDLS